MSNGNLVLLINNELLRERVCSSDRQGDSVFLLYASVLESEFSLGYPNVSRECCVVGTRLIFGCLWELVVFLMYEGAMESDFSLDLQRLSGVTDI